MNDRLASQPSIVLVLALFPSLAIATRTGHAVVLGAAFLVVLVATVAVTGLLNRVLLERSRQAVYLLVAASAVTGVDELLKVASPSLSTALGIYVPLLAVNCIILDAGSTTGEPPSYGRSVAAAAVKGAQFTAALALIALVREVLGAGTVTLVPLGEWDGVLRIPRLADSPFRFLATAGGALLLAGYLQALINWIGIRRSERKT